MSWSRPWWLKDEGIHGSSGVDMQLGLEVVNTSFLQVSFLLQAWNLSFGTNFRTSLTDYSSLSSIKKNSFGDRKCSGRLPIQSLLPKKFDDYYQNTPLTHLNEGDSSLYSIHGWLNFDSMLQKPSQKKYKNSYWLWGEKVFFYTRYE